MSVEKWTEVDEYINTLFKLNDEVLEDALKANEEAGLPAIDVSPSHGKFLHLLACIQGAKRILEIGTLGGYSTIWLARALPTDGKLITLEAREEHAEVARKNIANAGLENVVEVRVGKAMDTLLQLAEEGLKPFDLTFIDADKENNGEYFNWALKLSKPGSVIITDNVIRDGLILDASDTRPSTEGTRRGNELAAATPNVSATILQTVGQKDHDGFAIALVE